LVKGKKFAGEPVLILITVCLWFHSRASDYSQDVLVQTARQTFSPTSTL